MSRILSNHMRIETEFGRNILCGYILQVSQIRIGSEWQDSQGNVVVITEINADWITYTTQDKAYFEKDAFSFQTRYSLILREGEIV